VSRLDKVLVAAPALFILSSFSPQFLFSPYVAGAAPLAKCNAACPTNGLMIADRPSIAVGLGKTQQVSAALLAVGIVAAIVYRLAIATRPRRRALPPAFSVRVVPGSRGGIDTPRRECGLESRLAADGRPRNALVRLSLVDLL
jgi:hypothetical protein